MRDRHSIGAAWACLAMILLVLGAAPTLAHAYQLPSEVTSELDAVVEHTYRGSPQQAPPECGPVCDDLWKAERRATGVDSSVTRELNREARTLRIAQGLSPALRTLGTVGLVAGTFELGWKVGTGLRAKFQKVTMPAQPPLTSYFLSFRLGWLNEGAPISHAGTAPVDAFYLHASTTSGTLNGFLRPTGGTGACQYNFDPGGGAGFTDVTTGTSACWQGHGQPDGSREVHAYYRGENDFEAPTPVEDYTDQPFEKATPAPPDPGLSVAASRALNGLESGNYPTLAAMLEFELGTPGACDPIESFVCNPSPSQDEQDRRCEPSTPGGADPAPERGTKPFQPQLYDVVQTFTRRTPEGTTTPTALKYGWTSPSTRKGWLGWGYRHVYAKHGWTSEDIAATSSALQSPPVPEGPTRLAYTGPEYQRSGAICVRKVVVAFATERDFEPEPAEIITSYGRYVREA